MARFCPPTASSDLRVAVTVDGLILPSISAAGFATG